jgi:hypothetical protein
VIDWTPELKQRIIDGLEDYSLRKLCELNSDLPSRDSITDLMAKDEDFSSRCARARENHADVMDDRILQVAEKVENGTLDAKAGSVVISAFQWRAAKLKPKKYGERIQAEHTGPDGGPLQIVSTVPRPPKG